MKRAVMVFGVLLFTLLVAISVYAQEGEEGDRLDAREYNYIVDKGDIKYAQTPVNKLGRGIINTTTCWSEIPGQIAKVSREKDPFLGFTLGAIQGVVTTLVRGFTGIIDTLTFAAAPYDKPLMQPEYALKGADDEIKEYLW